jgi:cytochrome c oxidase subunit IV
VHENKSKIAAKKMKQKVTIEIICFLLILLFVYAAFSKLIEYNTFKIQLSNSPFLKPIAGIIVWFIPGAELVIAVMLTVMHTRKKALYSSFILLVIFSLYIAGMLLLGIELPCSCGGIVQQLSWKQHLLFNLFFMLLAFTGIVLGRHQKLKYAV